MEKTEFQKENETFTDININRGRTSAQVLVLVVLLRGFTFMITLWASLVLVIYCCLTYTKIW